MKGLLSIILYITGAGIAALVPAAVALRAEATALDVVIAVAVAIAAVVVAGSVMTLGEILAVDRRRRAAHEGDHVRQLGGTYAPDELSDKHVQALLARYAELSGVQATPVWARSRVGRWEASRVAEVRDEAGRDAVVVRATARDQFDALPTPDHGHRLVLAGEGCTAAAGAVALTLDGLNDPWYVVSGDKGVVENPIAISMLNTWAQPGISLAIEADAVSVWSDPGARVHARSMSDLASAFFMAVRADSPRAPQPKHRPKGQPRIGGLRTDSAARAQSTLRAIAGLIAIVIVSFGAVLQHGEARPGSAPWWVLAVQALALVAVGLVVVIGGPDYTKRQRAVATHALSLADERGWRYRQRDTDVERGWSKRPFARVDRLTASPVATGPNTRLGAGGVAYLEGDLGTWPLLRVFSSRVVWAELPEGLPTVAISRQGFSARMAKVVGGSDIDVESYAFNTAWRVRAQDARAAHAMLTPAVIHLLNEITDDDVCFLIDGTRVLLWDDGRAKAVDLEARSRWVDAFAAAIPRFLSEPVRD